MAEYLVREPNVKKDVFQHAHLNFFHVCRSLYAIGKGCRRLKNLTLSDCYFLSDKGLEAVAAGCSELTHLEVNGCHNISTSGLELVGRSCTYGLFSLICLVLCKFLCETV